MKTHHGAHQRLLSSAEEIRSLAESLKVHDVIALDTEFIRETTFYPIVEIIQVATDKESWLVDAQAFKKGYPPGPDGGFDSALKPLLDVFEDKKILKIVHAAQGDQECLFTAFGVVASPSLDTAVAASLCGYGEGVGLSKLLSSILGVTIKKGHARTNWSVRPLPSQLVEYAHADVIHLVELGRKLLAQLEALGRKQWALELSSKYEDTSLYRTDVEGMTKKLAKSGRLDKKGYSALLELVRWREERVRQLNLPRRWVADDTVLVDLAQVRPKDLEHLAAFRGLNKGELKSSGPAILSALEKASKAEDVVVPRMPRPEIPTPEESQVIDLLRCYIGILADQHKISARHLMNTSELLKLLRNPPQAEQDLVKSGVLGAEAARLIGKDLLEFIHGKRALSVSGHQILIIEVP